MKYIRYIIILLIGCIAFMVIDDVYAFSVSTKKGSCKLGWTGYQDGSYFVETDCSNDSVIYIHLNSEMKATNSTFVQSINVFKEPSTGTIRPDFSVFGSLTPISHIQGFTYDSVCDRTETNWCNWYTKPNTYSKSYTLYSYTDASSSYLTSSFIQVSGKVNFVYVPKFYTGNISVQIQNRYQAALSDATNEKLDDVNQSIKDQTDATNKVNDSLTDDSIDSDSAGGFFSGFDTEDNGGISSVITAPLIFVRKITDSCEPINIPFFDETIELPCGDTLFWNKPKVAQLRNIWNILFGGAFIFMLLRKVFKVIENIKDPESDKVEVMSL